MANVTTSIKNWSTTEASNQPDTIDSNTIVGDLRAIQVAVRYLYSQDTIASATTCDIGSKDAESLTISGTTTITGLGTVSAGIVKRCLFSGALTLTHNATSLILPGAANITTVAGDILFFESLGSGNWRCILYLPTSGIAVTTSNTVTLTNKSLTSPTLSGGTWILPDGAGTTTEGSMQWSQSGDLLTVGTGAAIKTMADTNSTQTLSGKTVSGPSLLSTSVLGFTDGAGGTVTQLTSKSTAVTINKTSGQITMHDASLAASTTVSFTVTNSTVGTTDTVILHLNFNSENYQAWVYRVNAGSFNVALRNISGGALAEAVILNYNVIEGVSS